ncbi:amidohydrolase family protein [Intrasporangium sp.]|uniref:amidohydrolase family protein n=1 Tax=Intrasporangium sp. TaxID=1925024 RepID=UPI00293B9BB2|nr:amidohydrolase family protein [Intrasporangium sp.]
MPIDLDAIDAIDVHTHVHLSVRTTAAAGEDSATVKAMGEYFGEGMPTFTLPQLAAYYRERRMAAVTFGVDSSSQNGQEMVPSNDEILELAAEHDDVIIPFGSIDPHRGALGVATARRLLEGGIKGFKFHPNTQGFYPNDRLAYPLYEVIAEFGAVALFHSGTTGVGARTPGGGGIRLKYSNPLCVDDVAVDFPGLSIIIAHPSFPWQDEALAVANHKPDVYIDLSGWSPKYFPPQLVQYANSMISDKVLFGSDFPVIMPERWMKAFDELPIKEHVRPKILKDNAARLFGLTGKSG